MTTKTLTTPLSVIDALGGLNGAMAVTGAKYTTVSMWTSNNRIPARYSAVINAELSKHGKEASLAVFGIIQPEKVA